MSIRAGCCGKKRKGSQLKWFESYDGGSWRCKDGYGCRKPKKCNKPHVGSTLPPLYPEHDPCNPL